MNLIVLLITNDILFFKRNYIIISDNGTMHLHDSTSSKVKND